MSRIPVHLLIAGAAALCCDSVSAAQPADLARATSTGDALVVYTEARDPCTERSATRNAYFGDLHIHTGFSYDARPFGSTTTPADAYRFARGAAIGIPPFDDSGRTTATLQLRTPLDFAAVTDHSEFFGELGLCMDPASSVYDIPACQHLRGSGGNLFRMFVNSLLSDSPRQVEEICGEDPTACVEAASSLWTTTQQMAEDAYDRSSRCEFTTFVGYEHTGTPNSNNYHRNVIFRNGQVPARAISYIDAPRGLDLWNALTEECLNAVDGCDVLVIPHNSNLSSGSMFPSYAAGSETEESAAAAARLQAAMEPIMEIFQHKGNSECFNGFPGILGAPDELCEFEQVRAVGERRLIFGETYELRFCEEGEIGRRGFAAVGCVSRNDFFRSVLLTGLQDEAVIGVNPYKFGAIGSTDTHLALSGATEESSWPGHLAPEAELESRLRSGCFRHSHSSATPADWQACGRWRTRAMRCSRHAQARSVRHLGHAHSTTPVCRLGHRRERLPSRRSAGARVRPRRAHGQRPASGQGARQATAARLGSPRPRWGGAAEAADHQGLDRHLRAGTLRGVRRGGCGRPRRTDQSPHGPVERRGFVIAVRRLRRHGVRPGGIDLLLPPCGRGADPAMELGSVRRPAPRRAPCGLPERRAQNHPGNGLDLADLVRPTHRGLACSRLGSSHAYWDC
jgi:hypothetical protein